MHAEPAEPIRPPHSMRRSGLQNRVKSRDADSPNQSPQRVGVATAALALGWWLWVAARAAGGVAAAPTRARYVPRWDVDVSEPRAFNRRGGAGQVGQLFSLRLSAT
jgi:hypothetical protein